MRYIEKNILDAYKSPFSSVLELHACVIEQWNQIPPDFCSRLFESVPYLSKWLMDEILMYDEACKSDYKKILVQN